MNWYEWFFDGIGTEIVSAIIGLLAGGIGGFFIGRRTKTVQRQKAGNDAKQRQQAATCNLNEEKERSRKQRDSIFQEQVAGDNAEQIQTGSVKNGH